MVHAMENGNGNGTSNRGRSTPKTSEKKDRDSTSPLSVKQEPTSPNEDVCISTEFRTIKTVLGLPEKEGLFSFGDVDEV